MATRFLLGVTAVFLSLIGNVVAQSSSVPTVSIVTSTTIGPWSGVHTNIPRWCGKPYEFGSPNYNPGGQLYAPEPSPSPMLVIQVQPRYTIYDSSERTADFIVDASISYTHGSPYVNKTSEDGSNATEPFTALLFDIRIEGTDELLVSNNVSVPSTNSVYSFDLTDLTPRLKPYNVVLYGAPDHEVSGDQTYTATTQLYYLPAKNTGSTVKVDNLYGGLVVANNVTDYAFEPLLPFGFYTSCGGYLNESLANVTAYKDLGFTAINPVCALPDGGLENTFDWLDQANMWYQYDMRNYYLNVTSIKEQIPMVKDRSALLTYYTADEPDGWQYALNSTKIAYDILKKEDPYHPTALVLNCNNYYFAEYSSGTDYVMADPYPVSINATWSRPYGVPVNITYGDCGCDDCKGTLLDVPDRLDHLYTYQEWLGQPEKSVWAVLQAFSGEGYWLRDPTDDETWAMMLLSFNHGGKGIMSWLFPSSPALNAAHGKFASIATTKPISSFLLGAKPIGVKVNGDALLDASYWILNEQVMVGLVNLDYVNASRTVEINLPVSATKIASQPWGSGSWSVSSTSNTSSVLKVRGLDGLATDILILDM